jgi:ubiquinone/menaquinone biosynthesis C-methylase UbiE
MNEKDYYENESFWTEERFLSNDQELKRFRYIHSLIPETTNSILDVGCGNGAFLKYLEDNGSVIKKIGYERSQTAVAKKVCTSEIISGSAEKITFPDNSFDVVLALEVIEHLPFGIFESTLEELQRVAAKNIIISVPYNEKGRLMKCRYCGCSFSPYYHLRSFDEKSMKTLFKDFIHTHFLYINKYRDYFVWNFFKEFWYSKMKKIERQIPANSVCPHCGYYIVEEVSHVLKDFRQNNINQLKSMIRILTPYRTVSTWIACIYQKC